MPRPVSSAGPLAFGRRRRGHRRGVADLVATILLVAIVVVLAAVLFVIVEQYTRSTSTTPNLGGSLVVDPPNEAVAQASGVSGCTSSPCNFYNMTVSSAASGMELHALALQIQALDGSSLTPAGGIFVLNSTGVVVAQYGYAAGWTSGGTVAVNSHLTIVLYTSGTTPVSLSGDYFRVIGVVGYIGSISVRIT